MLKETKEDRKEIELEKAVIFFDCRRGAARSGLVRPVQ
jgi:hypothetical protein